MGNKNKKKMLTIVRPFCHNNEYPLAGKFTLSENDMEKTDLLELTGDTVCAVMNQAIKTVSTPYIMFVEPNDSITQGYIGDVLEHISAYGHVQAFLPIVHEVDAEMKNIGMKNESAWAYGNTQQMGYLDMDNLKKTPNVSLSGIVMETPYFRAMKFKESMKVHYNLEFILRLLHKGNTCMVIPKIGVKHVLPLAAYYVQAKDMAKDELMFWFGTAKKEYYFDEDRNIAYKEKL